MLVALFLTPFWFHSGLSSSTKEAGKQEIIKVAPIFEMARVFLTLPAQTL